ncbi:hypothetical protein ACFWP3_03045 [Streptomyces sp. NPDC058525]|uniref:hypothetical protein n=1 Tax=Streptomyces sp. NPDC058525 TaxID=3346538 RepID=UPI00365F350B
MKFHCIKRAVCSSAVAGVLAAGLIAGTAGSASASTIRNGSVQLCAQANYPAYLEFQDRGAATRIVNPGECQWWGFGSIGRWEQINIVDAWSGKRVGSKWYEGSQTGIGIGAQGTSGGWQNAIDW